MACITTSSINKIRMKTYTDRNMKYTSTESESYLVGYDKYNIPIFTGDMVINIYDILGVFFKKILKGNSISNFEYKKCIKVTDDEFIKFINYFNPFNFFEKNRILYKPNVGDVVVLLSHRKKGKIVKSEDIVYVDVEYEHFTDKHIPIYEFKFEENIKTIRKNKLNNIISITES